MFFVFNKQGLESFKYFSKKISMQTKHIIKTKKPISEGVISQPVEGFVIVWDNTISLRLKEDVKAIMLNSANIIGRIKLVILNITLPTSFLISFVLPNNKKLNNKKTNVAKNKSRLTSEEIGIYLLLYGIRHHSNKDGNSSIINARFLPLKLFIVVFIEMFAFLFFIGLISFLSI